MLQRAVGDCGLASLATLLEQSYEDVYVKAATVDRAYRGKSGIHLATLRKIAHACGCELVRKDAPGDDDEGLLVVRWKRGSRHYSAAFRQHLVAVGHGQIVDPADGTILPADEYLAREKATAGAFLELR